MTARAVPPATDPVQPAASGELSVVIDGHPVSGLVGQSIAAVLLASGRLDWRRTSGAGTPRGIFCGIGVCFDCLVSVNGQRDVRACQRRASDGDVIEIQHDPLPAREEDR